MVRSKNLLFTGLALGLVITVLGLRWTIIDRFGMDLPDNDQWDAEGLHLLLPWYRNEPILPELFTPHNEHYVVLTKLLNLTLTTLNGQWDQRVEGVANAFLPAGLALAILLWARRFVRPPLVALLTLVLAASWGLPLAWQNVVAGFHSQQFFLIGLSFATIAWLPLSKTGSWRWWLGASAGAAALLSMASGFFAAVVVLVLLALRLVRRETTIRAAGPTIAVAVVLIAVGVVTRHEVYYHESLKAANVHDFVTTIVRSLQWPAPVSSWFAVLLWLPWSWLALLLLRNRPAAVGPRQHHAWILLGLGGWIWLQLLATAYARGADGPPPAARYLDTVVFGCVVNLLALGWLVGTQNAFSTNRAPNKEDAARSRPRTGLAIALGFAWLAIFGWGIIRESHQALIGDLRELRAYQKRAIIHTRAYVATHDIAYLDDPDIPYPAATSFVERIDHPELSRLLPVSVRNSIALKPSPGSRGFISSNNARPLPSKAPEPFGVLLGMSSESAEPLPPLLHRTWTSVESTESSRRPEWTSLPLQPPVTGGWLVFALNGDPRTALELRAAGSQRLLAEIRPTTIRRWTTAAMRAPDEPFLLHTRMETDATTLGFSEPVLMTPISYLAWRLTAHGKSIMTSGVITMLLCVGGMWLGSRRNRTTEDDTSSGDVSAHLDEEFYRSKSWGAVPIRSARDLPSLKLRYLMELLSHRSNKAARLLEVGSGSGRILSSIRQRDADIQLTGIDLSAEQTALAQSVHRDIEFVCGNGESLPFVDNSFDYVIFFDYLEHIERPRQSLAEMRRVLKPGGQLYLVCPAERQSIYGISSTLFRRHFKESTAGHIQQFSRRDLDLLVQESGLSISAHRYSYHLLGSLMDYTLFALMLHPRVYAIYWSGNPYYAKSEAQAKTGFFQRLLRFGNAIAYYESKLMRKIAITATAVHITAVKPDRPRDRIS